MTGLQIVSTIFLTGGVFFAITGSVGLLRMPDFFTRLHPAGKSDTLAQLLILVGLMFLCTDVWTVVKLGLLTGLLFVTSPTATHAISRAAQLDGEVPMTAEEFEAWRAEKQAKAEAKRAGSKGGKANG